MDTADKDILRAHLAAENDPVIAQSADDLVKAFDTQGAIKLQVDRAEAVAVVGQRAYFFSVPKLISAVASVIQPLLNPKPTALSVCMGVLASLGAFSAVFGRLSRDSSAICAALFQPVLPTGRQNQMSVQDLAGKLAEFTGHGDDLTNRVKAAIVALTSVGIVEQESEAEPVKLKDHICIVVR
jgi:hypothetical protein